MATHHLAQLNIGRIRFPEDDPRMSGFMDALDEINAIADAAPGFVWRLQDEAGNATSIRVYDDPQVLINLSVWESVDTLRAFTYASEHVAFLRRRGEWFEKPNEPHMVLWWVAAGHTPTVDEAAARLAQLVAEGPGPDCFTFRAAEPPPA